MQTVHNFDYRLVERALDEELIDDFGTGKRWEGSSERDLLGVGEVPASIRDVLAWMPSIWAGPSGGRAPGAAKLSSAQRLPGMKSGACRDCRGTETADCPCEGR